MGQEFIIKSQGLEDKINQLLPSQGGFQAGVDLSASTQIIPIIDLTETAEGSSLRQDLQTSLSHNSTTRYNVTNTTTDVVTTTGYWRVFGNVHIVGSGVSYVFINDGATNKFLLTANGDSTVTSNDFYDFNVFLRAGDVLRVSTSTASLTNTGVVRQLADINGNLVNP